jgi:micrococcal nuclease
MDPRGWVVIAGLLVLAACSPASTAPESDTGPNPTPPPGPHQAAVDVQVLRVVDGDTIEVSIDGAIERVRYIGIDTPEVNARCADEATRLNQELLGDSQVRLVPDAENRDVYGRILRYVYVGDVHINLELAKRGVAVVLSISPNTRHADSFKQAVATAKAGGTGCLWDPAGLAAETRARASATPTPTPTERLLITRFRANAAGLDQENLNEEYITIVNFGPALEIGGWTVRDRADHTYVFPPYTWPTGVELRLHTGSGTDADGVFYWNSKSPIWNNTGDTLWLEDADGGAILTYIYQD